MSDMPQSPEPKEECDLIMKGGITSGVVYPQAVLALKDRYRFRNIGGGSVGALAAALTAAAELGRDSGNETAGFKGLKKEQEKLQRPGFLIEVFQAPKSTRPLLNTLLDLAKKKKKGWMWLGLGLFVALPRYSPLAFLVGTLTGAVLAFFLMAWSLNASLSSQSLYFAALPLSVLIGLASVVASLLWILLKKIPRKNFYGLCMGSGEPGTEEQPLLTDWMSGVLDELAGIKGKGPLTFKHLKDAPMKGKKPDKPAITLLMLTTNLNHREPYLFPKDTNTFLFKKKEMDDFFPGYIVEYMVREGRAVALRAGVEPPEGYHFLPRGEDLPVIVPVRMGISFPILLSAVPLYTVKESAWDRYKKSPEEGFDPKKDLQLNLFSDGGICSNFPIHFFDGWLPGRPTFGINLTSMPEGERGDGFSVGDIYLPSAGSREPGTRIKQIADPAEPWLPKPNDPDSREWTRVKGLVQFGRAVFYSAMNYRDNMQSRLPSYQERTVQVPLNKEEGGLNLGMDANVIGSIAERGKKAGMKLLEGFEPDRLDHHRWVRLLVLMNQLETQLEDMTQGLDLPTVLSLIEKQRGGVFPYPLRDKDRCEEAKKLVESLYSLANDWKRGHGDPETATSADEPRTFPTIPDEDPQPVLRITPNV